MDKYLELTIIIIIILIIFLIIKKIINWKYIKPVVTVIGLTLSAIAFTISWFILPLIIFLIIFTLFSKTITKITKTIWRKLGKIVPSYLTYLYPTSYLTLILLIILSIILITLIVYSHCHIDCNKLLNISIKNLITTIETSNIPTLFIGDFDDNNPKWVSIILFAFAIFYTLIFEGFKEEIVEIFDWKGIKTFQTTFQNYLFILSMIVSIAVIIAINHCDSLLSLIINGSDSGNFLTASGILATISALLVSISWVIIQTSSERLSNILMWIWIRDMRFLTFVIISFTTVFLLVLISLTHVQLHVIDYGIIYYIIMLNFLMYSLYIKAFAKVINPKHAVDLILKTKDIGDESKGYDDLTDAESRLFAVYEIIEKRIEAGDIYAVIKCLNMINRNFDKYWIFNKDKNCKKYLEDFLEIIKKLEEAYCSNNDSNRCANKPYYEKGLEAFKKIKLKIIIALFDKTLEEKIKAGNADDVGNCLNEINNYIDNDNYKIFDNKAYIEKFKQHLNESLKKYEKEKNENRLNEEIFNKLNNGFKKLIKKCEEKLNNN